MNLAGIDLNLLVVLDALLEEQNVTRGGARVGLSQPATSNSLNRLRELLKDPILERDGRRMRLTARAHQLKTPLRHALNAMKRALEDGGDYSPSAARFTVRLFASDYITFLFLPALRLRLQLLAPGAELIVKWAERSRLFSLLESEEVDVAIGHYEDAPGHFHRRELYSEQSVCLGRRDHPAFEAELTLERLLAYPRVTISFEGLPFGYVDQALARRGVASSSEIVIPHFLAAPFMTLDSDLITITGEHIARRFADHLPVAWRPAPFPIEPLRIEMLWHAQSERDPALNWFRDQIVQIASEL